MSSRRAHIINGSGSLLIPASALLVSPILARALGPFERGLFSNDQALIMIASSVFALGISDTVSVSWHQWSATSRRRVSLLNTLTGAFFGLLLAGFASVTSSPSLWALILIVIGGCTLAVARHARGIAISHRRIAAVGLEKWVTALGRLILTITLAPFGILTVETALITIILPQFAGALYLLILTRNDHRETEKAPVDRRALMWMIGGGTASVILVNVDQAILLPFIGPTELGYYSIAVTIAEVYTAAAKPFRDAAMAAESVSSIRKNIWACILSLSGMSVVAASVMWFGVPFVFGADYTPAVAACYIMTIGGVAKGAGFLLNGTLGRTGQVRVRFYMTWLAAIVNIALIPVFAPLGAIGAAVAASIGYFVLMLGGLPFALRGTRRQPTVP